MGPLSVEDRVVNEDALVVTQLTNLCCLNRVDLGSKGSIDNGHEPTIEATILDISKTLVQVVSAGRLGWEAGFPGEGGACSWE